MLACYVALAGGSGRATGCIMILLMGQLNRTQPHYIRCVKPNDTKTPLQFIPKNCHEQLTYSGVYEAVAIRKQGFPFRLSHKDFAERYFKITKGNVSMTDGDAKSVSRAIIKHEKLDSKKCRLEFFDEARALECFALFEHVKAYHALKAQQCLGDSAEDLEAFSRRALAAERVEPPGGEALSVHPSH